MRPRSPGHDAPGERPANGLLGVRGFSVGPTGALMALTDSGGDVHRQWQTSRPTVAFCGPSSIPAPCGQPECHCGLNAFADLAAARRPISRIWFYRRAKPVLALVSGWGDVEVHRAGWRSQFAQVVALIDEPGADPDRRDLIRCAASRYGVPVVDEDRIVAVGSEHGRWLTSSDLPAETTLAISIRRPFVWEFLVPRSVLLLVLSTIVAIGLTRTTMPWLTTAVLVAPFVILLALVTGTTGWHIALAAERLWASRHVDRAVDLLVLLSGLIGSAAASAIVVFA